MVNTQSTLPLSPSAPVPVSVLILTKDEEINIAGCIRSLAWADEIVVLDSGSNDRTVEIAESVGCKIVHRQFDNWAAHQNWAVQSIPFRNNWVLNIDADERVSPQLASEVATAIADPAGCVAYRMRRKDYLRGEWLKHATFYPTWLIRLYRPETVRFERLVNPVTVVNGAIGILNEHFEHWPFSKGVSHWLERHNSYSTFEAAEYLQKPDFCFLQLASGDPNARRRSAKALFSRLPFRPVLKFLYLYIFHRGFLDGRAGLDYCLLQSLYEYMIALKVREASERAVVRRAVTS